MARAADEFDGLAAPARRALASLRDKLAARGMAFAR